MENVRSYCDDILDVIHKFGEEYIYDPRTKIIDGKDLFVSVDNNINNDIAYSDDSDNRSNEACVNLGLTFWLVNIVKITCKICRCDKISIVRDGS